jgi:hypothetical protein
MVNNKLNNKDSINYDLRELQQFASSHNRPLKSIIYFISASQEDSILLITDTDNDLDFTNEVIDVFSYDALPQRLGNTHISKMPKKKLKYEHYLLDKNEIIQRELDIRLFPAANRYKNASYSSKPKLNLVLKSEEGRVGDFSIGEEEYIVFVSPMGGFFDKYNRISLKVFNTNDSWTRMRNVNKTRLREEDFISFEKKLYQILSPSIFGSELILMEVLPNEVIYGDKPRQYIRDFEAATIDDRI